MTPEQKISALNRLLNLRVDNLITVSEFNIGSILLARDNDRIDYLVLAGLIGMTAPTVDTLLKRVRTCLSNLEATGMFRRVKEGKTWYIRPEFVDGKNTPVSTGKKTERNPEKNAERNAENLPEKKTDCDSQNHREHCTKSENQPEKITEDLPEKAAEDLPDHRIQDLSYDKSNHIPPKAPPLKNSAEDRKDELSEAVFAVYSKMNDLRKTVLKIDGSGYRPISNNGKLSKEAVKLQNIMQGLQRHGLAHFNLTDGRFSGKFSVLESVQLVCNVIEHVSRMSHTADAPQYFAPETLFNGAFGKRIGWYLAAHRPEKFSQPVADIFSGFKRHYENRAENDR